ncbi:hypothetical protein WA026_008690 [Henosepilachna vigintioctopunctata]|uniref:Retinol dehydrogenase 13 n=1 Tax=Henosepilachna vigintioctopunctata TaxID=420089 RepID=A0AAW1V8Z5_9CUCU
MVSNETGTTKRHSRIQIDENQRFLMMDSLRAFFGNVCRAIWYFVCKAAELTLWSFEILAELATPKGKCRSTSTLYGKTAVITGANNGIGKITARDFFTRGARVIMACRNLDLAEEAQNDIKKDCENIPNCGELLITKLDLSSLESVRKCAKHLLETENEISLLINNAGVMMCPYSKTEDGYELQFATNHLGHFLLTVLLLPKIIRSAPARIVTVSSLAHKGGEIMLDDLNWEKRPYDSLHAYQQSKLANILFSRELARKLKDANIQGVNTYSLHPGVIATDLVRHKTENPVTKLLWTYIAKPMIKTPEQGSQTTIYCAIDEKCENETGLYYSNCKVKEPSKEAKDDEMAGLLWDVSMKMVKLNGNYNCFQVSNTSL